MGFHGAFPSPITRSGIWSLTHIFMFSLQVFWPGGFGSYALNALAIPVESRFLRILARQWNYNPVAEFKFWGCVVGKHTDPTPLGKCAWTSWYSICGTIYNPFTPKFKKYILTTFLERNVEVRQWELVVQSSFIWVSYEKPSSWYFVVKYFWWGCRENWRLITLGSERDKGWFTRTTQAQVSAQA